MIVCPSIKGVNILCPWDIPQTLFYRTGTTQMCGRKEFGPPRDGAPGELNNFPMKVLGFSISKIKIYIENTEIRASGVIIKKISIFWTFFFIDPNKKKIQFLNY